MLPYKKIKLPQYDKHIFYVFGEFVIIRGGGIRYDDFELLSGVEYFFHVRDWNEDDPFKSVILGSTEDLSREQIHELLRTRRFNKQFQEHLDE